MIGAEIPGELHFVVNFPRTAGVEARVRLSEQNVRAAGRGVLATRRRRDVTARPQ